MHYQDSFARFITQIIFLQGCMKCHQDIFPTRCMNYHYDILQICILTKVFDILQGYRSKILSTRSVDSFVIKILVPHSTQFVMNI